MSVPQAIRFSAALLACVSTANALSLRGPPMEMYAEHMPPGIEGSSVFAELMSMEGDSAVEQSLQAKVKEVHREDPNDLGIVGGFGNPDEQERPAVFEMEGPIEPVFEKENPVDPQEQWNIDCYERENRKSYWDGAPLSAARWEELWKHIPKAKLKARRARPLYRRYEPSN